MDDFLKEHFYWVFVAFFLLIILNSIYIHFTRYRIGIKGECIWKDQGRQTKPFFNNDYQVYGKPDLLYETEKGIILVEYKSRVGRCYPNDIVQAKCAALAARDSGYPVYSILVKTGSIAHKEVLPEDDQDLYQQIKEPIEMARAAKAGESLAGVRDRGKCLGCGYRTSCKERLA